MYHTFTHNKIEFPLCNADLDYTNREISDRKGKSSLKVHLMRKEDLIRDKTMFVPIPTYCHLLKNLGALLFFPCRGGCFSKIGLCPF